MAVAARVRMAVGEQQAPAVRRASAVRASRAARSATWNARWLSPGRRRSWSPATRSGTAPARHTRRRAASCGRGPSAGTGDGRGGPAASPNCAPPPPGPPPTARCGAPGRWSPRRRSSQGRPVRHRPGRTRSAPVPMPVDHGVLARPITVEARTAVRHHVVRQRGQRNHASSSTSPARRCAAGAPGRTPRRRTSPCAPRRRGPVLHHEGHRSSSGSSSRPISSAASDHRLADVLAVLRVAGGHVEQAVRIAGVGAAGQQDVGPRRRIRWTSTTSVCRWGGIARATSA